MTPHENTVTSFAHREDHTGWVDYMVIDLTVPPSIDGRRELSVETRLIRMESRIPEVVYRWSALEWIVKRDRSRKHDPHVAQDVQPLRREVLVENHGTDDSSSETSPQLSIIVCG